MASDPLQDQPADDPLSTTASFTVRVQSLSAALPALDELVEQITAHDSVSPLDEQNRTELARAGGVLSFALDTAATGDDDGSNGDAPHGRLVGFSWRQPDGSCALGVRPGSRRRGAGLALAQALPAPLTCWAHGSVPGSAQLAERLGLGAERALHRMLAPLPAPEPGRGQQETLPAGFTVRGYDPADPDMLAALVAVNAAAFSALPDQGSWTAQDFHDRFAQPWFDPDDLLLLYRNKQLAGFHWVKHSGGLGEVYVIGLDPAAQGLGLGRTLLELGFARLRTHGVHEVDLYVDAANTAAVALYRKAGFAISWTDTWYAPARQSHLPH